MRSQIFFGLVLAAAACGTSNSNSADQADSPTGKADGEAKPAGAYTNATPHFGELTTLSLNSDYTFTSTRIGACPGGGTCAPITESGTYLFTHSSTKHYIRLYDSSGNDLNRYAWKLDASGALSLEEDGSTDWFAMAQGSTCESAGGNCVPLVPDACAIGSVGDATQYSCGGGVGVECCLPPQASNSCNADSDCSGSLPGFCSQCSDGSTTCAHWSCVENACKIAVCN